MGIFDNRFTRARSNCKKEKKICAEILVSFLKPAWPEWVHLKVFRGETN